MDLNKFKQALQFTLKWEGGYVNDPKDPGGETKYGISKRSYPNVDIKNLSPEQALGIYLDDFWQPIGGDNLPLPTCVVAFDSAVTCGVSRLLDWLRTTKNDWKQLIDYREQYYLDLVKRKPTLQIYLKGWLNRTNDLKKYCEVFSSNV